MATVESKSIQPVKIGGTAFGERWGNYGYEYIVSTNGATQQYDFQDLMIDITHYRAVSVEQGVLPMERRMKWRNSMLEKLGTALSEITGYSNKINTDDQKDPEKQKVDVSWSGTAREALSFAGSDIGGKSNVKKYELDKANQQVKTKTDRLNNDASRDSTRLQSLVDRRDQAYQTSTTLMTSISDTRTNLIRNIG